jgi:hypothetical protein
MRAASTEKDGRHFNTVLYGESHFYGGSQESLGSFLAEGGLPENTSSGAHCGDGNVRSPACTANMFLRCRLLH